MSILKQSTNDETLTVVPPSAVVAPAEEASKEQDAIRPDDSALRPELQKVFEEGWKQNEAGYRHLAGR